ncbi:aldo/keto reductase [Kineobactrum salinum]|uniref:Aldo/keto reductase n=1 Tax=Kineobactrum salinum TaxID=2708301 RepID=A0A6C0U192_9GAMM|nr:aldo/keto reductase [Kineobactrum salinum]QIB65553.1 aldo/keto reductase [Kineobactrum salinum]
MTVERFTIRPDFDLVRIPKGNWQLADDHSGRQFDQTEVNEHLTMYVEAGIDTFVCGDIYAGVEERLGRFRDYYRDLRGAAAASKIKVLTTYVPYFLEKEKLRNHSKADVERVVDRSLKRLRQERLDLVQMHWWDYSIPGSVDMALWLQELQCAGKIHHIGATNFDVPHMREFFDAGVDVVSLTCQYSLLDSRPLNGMIELCREHDCYLLCYGVLGGGLISERWLGVPDPGGPYLENVSLDKYYRIIQDMGGWELFQELLSVLKSIADKHRVSIANVASRYMLDQDQVATINIGARDASHLEDNLRVFGFALDADDMAKLQTVLEKRTGPKGDVYGIDRDECRDELEEVKTEYYDVEDGQLIKKTRDPVLLTGDAAYGHHLHQH